MAKKDPKQGDACPQCSGTFRVLRVPTDAEYAKSVDRENPVALPPGVDTASPDFRKEYGALQVCTGCGYNTRVQADAPAADSTKGN